MAQNLKEEGLKVLLEQHMLHTRHIENERLWFTNVFAILTGGVLSVTRGDFRYLRLVAWLMFPLSLLGFCLTIKLAKSLTDWRSSIRALLKDFNLSQTFPYYVGDTGWWRYFKVRYGFILFYASMSAFWFLLLIRPNLFDP